MTEIEVSFCRLWLLRYTLQTYRPVNIATFFCISLTRTLCTRHTLDVRKFVKFSNIGVVEFGIGAVLCDIQRHIGTFMD